MEKPDEKCRIIARNRKARYDFQIQSTLEAGLELRGFEVKSLRDGKINMGDAYAYVDKGQVFLKNLHISPYQSSAAEPIDPMRTRRLLLHRREIYKLSVQTEQKGLTLVPLSIYFRGKVAKIELGLAVGRKKHDKREVIHRREAQVQIDRALKRDSKK